VTDLVLPDRSNPKECLEWGLQTLDVFSRKELRGALGAKAIQAVARRLIAEALKADPNLYAHRALKKWKPLYRKNLPSQKQSHLEKFLPKPNPQQNP
jgi:hypothetical protein